MYKILRGKERSFKGYLIYPPFLSPIWRCLSFWGIWTSSPEPIDANAMSPTLKEASASSSVSCRKVNWQPVGCMTGGVLRQTGHCGSGGLRTLWIHVKFIFYSFGARGPTALSNLRARNNNNDDWWHNLLYSIIHRHRICKFQQQVLLYVFILHGLRP